jgi:glycosyltransferase involved in cell wall biosynthesis
MTREQRAAGTAKARLLYVVTEDWAFLSHRLPMARAAREAGFEVHVATRVSNRATAIEAERFILHPIPFVRGSLSPSAMFSTIAALRRVHRDVKPVLTHHVALQACVLGSVAALGQPTATVNAFIGLGYSFTSSAGKARALRRLIGMLLRFLVNGKNRIALVQNSDDAAALISIGIAKNRIALIPGSGVDVDRFTPLPEPQGPPTFGFVGRLLDDKGIHTLIAAHRSLRARVPDARLIIAGTPDAANPASVTEAEAKSWNKQPGVRWLGHVNDIEGFWAQAHVAVLPSRREGLPLSLMEAAACGRAMIATDVPGCREIVAHDQTGLLFPLDDTTALADAMARLAADPALRSQYAAAARRRVVEKFAAAIIGPQTVALYERVLGNRHFGCVGYSEEKIRLGLGEDA